MRFLKIKIWAPFLIVMLSIFIFMNQPKQAASRKTGDVIQSEGVRYTIETFAQGLNHPWGGVLLPSNNLLVTERIGNMRLVHGTTGAISRPLSGLPHDIFVEGQGGLLDVTIADDFERTREIFFCYAAKVGNDALTRMSRGVLSRDEGTVSDVRTLVDAGPARRGGQHFGCRIVQIGNHLFLSTGDRGDQNRAQKTDDLAGKIIRINRNGTIPTDNPFIGNSNYRPEIWAMGVRNPQGMTRRPNTNEIWESEHGPRGGDEVNNIRKGLNYGWPLVTFGKAYSGASITPHTSLPGMESPVKHWVPGISPAGISFVPRNSPFREWAGNLLVGSMNAPTLTRIDLATGREERMLEGRFRIRAILWDHVGNPVLLEDHPEGRVLKLKRIAQ